jgi:hypothetical protein
MNTTPQLDVHPDAESLSAFAEHLLPDHERQPILAHLAVCARCRQILFLAQDADPTAGELPQPVPAGPVLLASQAVKKAPFGDWRFAWGALTACAALVALSIYLYPRHRADAPQQARAVSPGRVEPSGSSAPPQASETKPLPTSQTALPHAAPEARQRTAIRPGPAAGTIAQARINPPAAAAAKPAAQLAPALSFSATPSATAAEPALPPGQASETVVVDASAQPLIPSQTPVQAPAPARARSEATTVNVTADNRLDQSATPPLTETMSAQNVQPENQIKLRSKSLAAIGSAHAASKAPGAAGGSSAGMTAGAGGGIRGGTVVGAVTSSSGTLAQGRAASGRPAERPLVETAEDESAARATLQKNLPSGLPAVAATSAGHHLLAIDSTGNLFVSEDGGAVWESVARQWTGRAVRVSFSPAGAPAAASPSGAAGSSVAAAPAASFFEIVTDGGLIWTSSDGRSWKPR